MVLTVIYVLWAGIFAAIGIFFCASLLYFIFAHRAGTADYIAKTVAIGLLTVPVATLLCLALIIYAVTTLVRGLVQHIEAICRCLFGSTQPETSIGDEPAATDQVTVHLIHGTFERRAPWTLPGSDLRKAIRDIGEDINIARFSWSGDNTPTARTRAAQALAKKLGDSPSRRHYIVAHSHGGNILREMSHEFPWTALKIKGVCLLSPPFIFRKELTRTAGRYVLLNGLGFIFAVQIPVAGMLMPFCSYWPFGFIAASIAAFFVEFRLSKFCRSSISEEMKGENESNVVDFRDVQIYHAIGDEADSALRFVSSLHEACFGVLSQLKAAAKLARGRFHWPYLMSYAFFICLIGYAAASPTVSKAWVAVNWVGAFAILVAHVVQMARPSKDEPPVLLAAALPIVTFSFWLAVAKAMAYGDWRLIFCPDIFVSSSETPTGDHRVLKFAPESDGTMVHSTHSHPEAVRNVASWLTACLERKAP